MISGQWFQRKDHRIEKKLYKINQSSIRNMGISQTFPNLVEVHPRNSHTKFATNQFIRL